MMTINSAHHRASGHILLSYHILGWVAIEFPTFWKYSDLLLYSTVQFSHARVNWYSTLNPYAEGCHKKKKMLINGLLLLYWIFLLSSGHYRETGTLKRRPTSFWWITPCAKCLHILSASPQPTWSNGRKEAREEINPAFSSFIQTVTRQKNFGLPE